MELPPYSPSTTPLSRYLGWGVLLATAAVFGALVSRFPLFAFALAGCVILLWIAWPRWIRQDIEYFAGAVLISSTLMGLPRLVQMGPYTLDAALSIATVVFAVLLLARNSWNIGAAWHWLWPLAMFLAWSYLSFLRIAPTESGIQNVLVYTGFLVIAAVTIVRTVADRELPWTIEALFERTYWLLAAFGAVSIVVRGPGEGYLLAAHGSSRSFSLVALLGVASGLARWRYGETKRGAAMVGSGVLLIALSLSRTAFLVGCLLIPLAWFSLKSLSSFVRVLTVTIIAIAIAWTAVLFIRPLHERFFPPAGEFVKVGQYDLNANGRKLLWEATWRQFLQSPIVGNGAGASEGAISTVSQVAQPHNDYLRLLDDYGLLGTTLWALGAILIVGRLTRTWIEADANDDSGSRFYLWAVLSLVAILLTMITDNPLVYLHVQAPLALIIGVALGRAEQTASSVGVPAASHVSLSDVRPNPQLRSKRRGGRLEHRPSDRSRTS
jgi:O-antigen ligase